MAITANVQKRCIKVIRPVYSALFMKILKNNEKSSNKLRLGKFLKIAIFKTSFSNNKARHVLFILLYDRNFI